MNPKDPLHEILQKWEPKSPHSTAKFVNDTLRAIRLRETRPAWKILWHGWLERIDGWMGEWFPAPQTLVPVAAALILLVTLIRWTDVDDHAKSVAALRWQQSMTQPMGQGSLTGRYASLIKE